MTTMTQAKKNSVMKSTFDLMASDMAVKYFEEITNHPDKSWRGGVSFDGLDIGTSIDELKKNPGFDWEVEAVPLHTAPSDGSTRWMNSVGLRRKDNPLDQFGTTTKKFVIVQNDEAIEWFKPFFDSGLAMFESAGTFKNGQRCWMMARMAGKPLYSLPDDPFLPYLLMTWGHDGRTALTIQPVAYRIACANQLPGLIQNGHLMGVKLKHRSGIDEAMKEVQDITKQAYGGFKDMEATLQRLGKVPVNQKSLENYFRRALKLPWRDPNALILDNMKFEEQMDKVSYNLNNLFNCHEEERHTLPSSAHDTFNHALNSVTRFATHKQKAKDASTRFENNYFGPGAQLATRALKLAEEMAA